MRTRWIKGEKNRHLSGRLSVESLLDFKRQPLWSGERAQPEGEQQAASPNKGRHNLQLKCLCMGGWGQVRAIGQGPPQSFSLMHAQIYKSPQNVYGALMGIDKTFDSF